MDVVASEPTGFQAPSLNMVVWFFERASRTIKIETRYDADRREYLAITIDAERRETIARFADADQFCSWLLTVETALIEKGWRPRDAPVLMPAARCDAVADARLICTRVAPEPIAHGAERISLWRRLRFPLDVFSGRRHHAPTLQNSSRHPA